MTTEKQKIKLADEADKKENLDVAKALETHIVEAIDDEHNLVEIYTHYQPISDFEQGTSRSWIHVTLEMAMPDTITGVTDFLGRNGYEFVNIVANREKNDLSVVMRFDKDTKHPEFVHRCSHGVVTANTQCFDCFFEESRKQRKSKVVEA